MKVLGIDGGAERLGWAIVEDDGKKLSYLDSGIVRMPRNKGGTTFQNYRIEFIKNYVSLLTAPGSILDQSINPVDAVVNETVPAVGSFGGTQMYLVNVAVTILQTITVARDIPLYQIGATSVHTTIVGKRPKGKKITKPQVRNAVIDLLPEVAHRKSDWIKSFDEPDAIAVAAAYLLGQRED